MIKFFIVLGLSVAIATAHGHVAGSAPTLDTGPDRHEQSREQLALESYRDGTELIDDALLIEERADQANSERRRAKGYKKAQKRYRKAIQKFVRALEYEPLLYQAHTALGQARSKTGDDERAMHSYNRALELSPRNTEVMAWRAVTLLKLGRLEDAQSTYSQLIRRDSRQASFLRNEMLRWQKTRPVEGGSSNDMSVQAFDRWLATQAG